MSQHDFVIANQGFPATRADINNFLQAVASTHSGTTTPSGAVAGTIWLDTSTGATTPTLKYYDGTDNITLATIDHVANTVNFSDSALDLITDTTPELGGDLNANGNDIQFDDNTGIRDDSDNEQLTFQKTASAVNELTITNSATANAPELSATGDDTNIDLKLTPKGTGKLNLDGIKFPNADGVNNQILKTDGAGALSFINPPTGFRNIVINGDMSIAQRSTSVASITASGYNTLDRFNTSISSLGTWTQSQSTDTPTGEGFATSLKMDCTTADASPSAGDFLVIQQIFEGKNLQYLKKGTANAVQLTASFYVKSTKTGTFVVELEDTDNSRTVSASYTVNVTNTWEEKSVTFPADTTGAFTNDNGSSLQLNFWLGAGTTFTSGTLQTTWGSLTNANRAVGQVNIADSTSNDWLITGVQLEAGTNATDFEFLPVDVNLGRCQRYFEKGGFFLVGYVIALNNMGSTVKYAVVKRAAPTITQTNFSSNNVSVTPQNAVSGTAFQTESHLSFRSSTVSASAQFNEDWTVSAEL